MIIAAPSCAEAQCFTQADLARVSPQDWRVEMLTTCPHDNVASGYKYLPQTACTSSQLNTAQTSTSTVSVQNASLWVNRSADGPTTQKPNPPPGPNVLVDGYPCHLKFATKDIADAVTLAQVSYVIGRWETHNGRNGWRDYTRHVGMADDHVLEWADFVALAPTICTGSYVDNDGAWRFATGYAVMPSAKLSTVPVTLTGGVELDYERHDCDSAVEACTARTNALIKEASQNLHALGFQLKFRTNPLYGNAQAYNGLDASNADYVLSKVDTFGILVWPANPQGLSVADDLDLQMSYFAAPDTSKLNLFADMQMTVDQAAVLRAKIVDQYHFGGVEPWLHSTAPCTPSYNAVLEVLLGF